MGKYNSTIIVKKRGGGKRKKMGGTRPWMWRAGPKQGRGLGGEWGLCLGPTGLEKVLGAVGGGA